MAPVGAELEAVSGFYFCFCSHLGSLTCIGNRHASHRSMMAHCRKRSRTFVAALPSRARSSGLDITCAIGAGHGFSRTSIRWQQTAVDPVFDQISRSRRAIRTDDRGAQSHAFQHHVGKSLESRRLNHQPRSRHPIDDAGSLANEGDSGIERQFFAQSGKVRAFDALTNDNQPPVSELRSYTCESPQQHIKSLLAREPAHGDNQRLPCAVWFGKRAKRIGNDHSRGSAGALDPLCGIAGLGHDRVGPGVQNPSQHPPRPRKRAMHRRLYPLRHHYSQLQPDRRENGQ